MAKILGKAVFIDTADNSTQNIFSVNSQLKNMMSKTEVTEIVEMTEPSYNAFLSIYEKGKLKKEEMNTVLKFHALQNITGILFKPKGHEHGVILPTGEFESSLIAPIESIEKFTLNAIPESTRKNSAFILTLEGKENGNTMKIAMPCDEYYQDRIEKFIGSEYRISDIHSSLLSKNSLEILKMVNDFTDLNTLAKNIKQQDDKGLGNFEKYMLTHDIQDGETLIEISDGYRWQANLIDDIKKYVKSLYEAEEITEFVADMLCDHANHIAYGIYDSEPVHPSFYEEGIKEIFELNDMDYGYKGYGVYMLPISREEALASPVGVYKIYSDDTEGQATCLEDVDEHNGYFALEINEPVNYNDFIIAKNQMLGGQSL